MTSNELILTPACQSVNTKMLTTISEATMRKNDFDHNELKTIGIKLSYLIKKNHYTQVQAGELAFSEKSRGAAKQYMKRICLGQNFGLRKEEVVKILNVINVSWVEFSALQIKEEVESLVDGFGIMDLGSMLSNIWPEGRKLTEMYVTAMELGNNDLADVIKKHMAESMKKAADDLLKNE